MKPYNVKIVYFTKNKKGKGKVTHQVVRWFDDKHKIHFSSVVIFKMLFPDYNLENLKTYKKWKKVKMN